MRPGDRVVIYSSPWARTYREGIAVLVERTSVEPSRVGGRACEWWRVRFEDDPDALLSRWVCAEDVLGDPAANPGQDPDAASEGGVDLWQIG